MLRAEMPAIEALMNDLGEIAGPVERFLLRHGLFDGLGGQKDLMWLDLAAARAAAYDEFGASPGPLKTFFDRHMGAGAEQE